jgi:hypothetical protein
MMRGRFIYKSGGAIANLINLNGSNRIGAVPSSLQFTKGGVLSSRNETFIDGQTYSWGVRADSINGTSVSVDGNSSTNAGATQDFAEIETLFIASSPSLTLYTTGVTDLTYNQDMADSDWYKEVDWSDAVNYLNDYIQYHGRLIPADIDISYDIQYEEAA